METRRTKRGELRWRVHWRQDGEKQSETFSNREIAKKFMGKVTANGNRWPDDWVPGSGELKASPNPSGFNVRTAALKRINDSRKSLESTKEDYRRELNRYLPEDDPLASIYVEDVTVGDILSWQARLARKKVSLGGPKRRERKGDEAEAARPERTLSIKTQRNAHSLVSGGLDLMVMYDYIPKNPAKGQGPTGGQTNRIQALTPEQFQALLTYITEHYQPFVEALARTGMRFGELTALTVRDVNLVRNRPETTVAHAWKRTTEFGKYQLGLPKSGVQRSFPIDDDLTAILRQAMEGKRPGDFIFTTVTGAVIRHSNFYTNHWRPAVRKAYDDGAIPFRATIHDLRHAHASWLLAAGVPVHSAANRLGHKPEVLLSTYAHLFDPSRAQAAAVIGELLRKEDGEGGS